MKIAIRIALLGVLLVGLAGSVQAFPVNAAPAQAELKGFCEIGCDIAATACRIGCYRPCALADDPPACRAEVRACRAACEVVRDACYAACDEEDSATNLNFEEWDELDLEPVCSID